MRLSQEQPSEEDEYSQNYFRCTRGDVRVAVQEKDTAHVKRLARGAERDMKLKYRTVVLWVLSRLPRRDRVSHSGVEDFSWPCSGRAQHTRQRRSIFSAEHVKVKQCAKQRSYRQRRPHTVVLKASADHAVTEIEKTGDSPQGQCHR